MESLSSQHWELFYSRNASKFFKDRHYLERDYPELFAHMPPNASMLECGCGAGNTVWPLLEKHPLWTARAFDCSATAVRIVQERRHPQVAACCTWRSALFVASLTHAAQSCGTRARSPRHRCSSPRRSISSP